MTFTNGTKKKYNKNKVEIIFLSLQGILPDALRTKCARCSPKQKESALKIITKLYQEYPHYYKALCERWDPTGEYNRRFEEYLQDEQFNIVGNNERPSFDYNRDQQPSEQPVLAPVPARTTVRTTTTQRATRPPIIITLPTERPNRSPAVGSNTLNRIPDQNFSPSINTANRFGDEEVQSVSFFLMLYKKSSGHFYLVNFTTFFFRNHLS